jgi:peptidoglycan/LPS O-acetylase OafA/YrhL
MGPGLFRESPGLLKIQSTWKYLVMLPAKRTELPKLNGLRALAILMVVPVHALAFKLDSTFKEVVGALISGFALGVPIFFSLSGFLVSRPFFNSVAKGQEFHWGDYLKRRFAKIVPPFYLALLAVAAIVEIPAGAHGIKPWLLSLDFVKWASFLQPFFPTFYRWDGGVFWSLPVEVYFYLILPLLFFLVIKTGWSRPKSTSTALRISVILPIALAFISVVSFVRYLPTEWYPWSVGRNFIYFAWGSLGAWATAIQWKPARFLARLSVPLFAMMMVSIWLYGWKMIHTGWQPTELIGFQWMLGALLFAIILPNPEKHGILERASSLAFIKWTAAISYEWYLFHVLIIRLINPLIGSTNNNPLYFAIRCLLPILLSYALASLIYRFYSWPLHEFILRGSKRR